MHERTIEHGIQKVERAKEILKILNDKQTGKRRKKILSAIASSGPIPYNKLKSKLSRDIPSTSIWNLLKSLERAGLVIIDDDDNYSISSLCKELIPELAKSSESSPRFKIREFKELIRKKEPIEYTRKASKNEFRIAALDLARIARESFHSTSIYPPYFWLAGKYSFNWHEVRSDLQSNGKPIIDCIYNKTCTDIGSEVTLTSNDENIIKAQFLEDQYALFKLNKDRDYASLVFSHDLSNEIKLVKKIYNGTTNIYLGDYGEISYYKQYLDYINAKMRVPNDKKVKAFITDIKGGEEDWKKDENIIYDYITNYHNNVIVKICSKTDVGDFYRGDVIIFDKNYVLMYDETVEGQKLGNLKLSIGDDLAKKYLELFETDNIPWVDPDTYWGLKSN